MTNSNLALPEGYELKVRRFAYVTSYYWMYAGGEQWGKDFSTRNAAIRDAIKHAETNEDRR